MKHTLLVGCVRTGGTWLGKLLDAHPNVLYLWEPDNEDHIKGEQNWGAWDFTSQMNVDLKCVTHRNHVELKPKFNKLLQTHVVSKVISPVGYTSNPFQFRMDPAKFDDIVRNLDAKIIHIVRHPLRWFASVHRWVNGQRVTGITNMILSYCRTNVEFNKLYERDPRYTLVKHEDAVADPSGVACSLLKEIGLDMHPQVHAFAQVCHQADEHPDEPHKHSCVMRKESVLNRWKSLPDDIARGIDHITNHEFNDFYDPVLW